MEKVLPEGLKAGLEAIPKPGPGQFIALSLSMTIHYAFPFPGTAREKDQIRLDDVVAIVSGSVYPSLVSLIEDNIGEKVPEERHREATLWLTDLWERRLLIQPRFGGLIPDYPRGGWRWTGEPTAIPFRNPQAWRHPTLNGSHTGFGWGGFLFIYS